ncbi:MAG: hypothetical protein CVU38_03800 [Chloroflexi bacterium HGW-Chloroflexi-1]|nr:MAG: hypothetical protein CVU38_03800 [Chloroflexi bacterium HGW-Chloroflexi-1]
MTAKKWLPRVLALLLLAVVVWLGWHAGAAAKQAQLALGDLKQIEALAKDPSPAALPALRDDLAALEAHLTATRAAASPFLWLAPGLGWLPEIGPTVRAGPPLLEMAIELAGGGREALDALAPVTDLSGEDGDLLARAVPALEAAAPGLAAADSRLAKAEALRAGVQGPLHPKLAPQIARLDRFLPLARAGLQAAQVAPALFGAGGPRSYLIMAQNNHELRATGGFISGGGVVTLDGGKIVALNLTDSYAVDNFQQPHPLPPASLRQQMGTQLLVFRDSNWSPDFPTSAQVARALYEQDQGIATDGAIALDLEAVRLLVGALGPLEAPGIEGPVTGANVIARMKQAWESPTTSQGTVEEAQSSDWWRKRKDFMGQLVAVALTRLQGGGDLDVTALAYAAINMLEGRHLQIAVDDPALAAVLAECGWDGGLRPPEGSDFLAVVDSNVGFNKANAAVQSTIDYRVAEVSGRLEATLTLTYTHTAPAYPADQPCDRSPRYGDTYDDLIDRCYWDYLRVYTPRGSELIDGDGLEGFAKERGERGAALFVGAFVLRPDAQHTVTVRYRLPEGLSASPYRLLVRKQAGTLAPALRVATDDCQWETDLGRDRVFICDGVTG